MGPCDSASLWHAEYFEHANTLRGQLITTARITRGQQRASSSWHARLGGRDACCPNDRLALAPTQPPSPTVHNEPANPTRNRKGDLIIGDVDDYLARVQCPRCGALSRHPCEAVRPGAYLVGYHRERGYRPRELLDLGYIKYTLVNESTQQPLFLWRRRTQRPIIRSGYRLSD
jgi:hypothetical protein